MYRKVEQPPSPPFDFEFFSGGKVAEDNRWAIGARLIPRSEFEAEYAQNFAEGNECTCQMVSAGVGGVNY